MNVLEGWEPYKCTECGAEFHRKATMTGEVCARCSSAAVQAKLLADECMQVSDSIDAILPAWCEQAGMSKRELTADLNRIPTPLQALLYRPHLRVREVLLPGRVPEHGTGFGISGSAGTGKTMALAAVMMTHARHRILAEAPRLGKKATRGWLRWVRWPERVNTMRMQAGEQMQEVNRFITLAQNAPMLVLDDLGAERMRTGYADDWSASILDSIIDHRHNVMLPTWWTTNLDAREFIARYGSRLYSRIAGDNPLQVLGAQPDLRVRKGAG